MPKNASRWPFRLTDAARWPFRTRPGGPSGSPTRPGTPLMLWSLGYLFLSCKAHPVLFCIGHKCVTGEVELDLTTFLVFTLYPPCFWFHQPHQPRSSPNFDTRRPTRSHMLTSLRGTRLVSRSKREKVRKREAKGPKRVDGRGWSRNVVQSLGPKPIHSF